MRLVCPSCGAIHSAEAWSADADARQCLRLTAELPGEVSRRCLPYLALFRPTGGRGLRWSKALRLLAELRELVTASHVSWDKKPARPGGSRPWALALERVIERPPRHLPLTGHNYLRAVAWEVADELDRGAERRQIRDERQGQHRGVQRKNGEPEQFAITREEIREMRRQAKHGSTANTK